MKSQYACNHCVWTVLGYAQDREKVEHSSLVGLGRTAQRKTTAKQKAKCAKGVLSYRLKPPYLFPLRLSPQKHSRSLNMIYGSMAPNLCMHQLVRSY